MISGINECKGWPGLSEVKPRRGRQIRGFEDSAPATHPWLFYKLTFFSEIS